MTTIGLPFVRAAGEIAAVTAVGGFLTAAFLVPPQPTGVLDAAGYRALRLARSASGLWAVCAAMLVPLTVSDVSGMPLREHLDPVEIWRVAGLIDTADAWRWTAALALAVTLAATPVLRWSPTPALLAGSLLTFVPVILTGHSAAGGSHDLATDSLLIHLVAGSLWVGGLLALLVHALRGSAHTDVAARRFSAVALGCVVAMAVSGTVNALVRIGPGDVSDTEYGNLVLVKIGALIALAVIGWLHRRNTVTALRADPGARAPLIRLALVEAAVFGLTVGVAVGLGRTPPPPPRVLEPSPVEVALGYALSGPPTPARLLAEWRVDLIFGSAAIVLAVVYLAGVVRLRRRGVLWPAGRAAAWLAGCAVLLLATSSGVGRYAPAMFSVHMAAQVLLALVAPALLALGAPADLAARALRPSADAPGPREWLRGALRSRPVAVLTRPVVATAVLAAGFFMFYPWGLFDAAVASHAAHVAMKAVFLACGLLFFAMLRRSGPGVGMAAAAAVLLVLPLGAAGLIAMNTRILGERFYRSLDLPWGADLSGDQDLGALIAGSAGVVPLAVVAAMRVGAAFDARRRRR